jgi:hypothetical protein
VAAAVLLIAFGGSAAERVDPATLDGKVLFGYQGWFDCPNGWSHWARGLPTAESIVVDLYPDLREFDKADLCPVPGMSIGDGPAFLFSARNPRVVQRHFEWMRDYGLDGVLLQRFLTDVPRMRMGGDIVLHNVMAAAERTGRVFAIEYDVSGARPESVAQQLQDDWNYLVETVKVTAQPNYLHHKGKPVLAVWGMGLSEGRHPPATPEEALALVRRLKEKVTYVGGTPARWRTLRGDAAADPEWAAVYRAMDVVQPWTVGRYRNESQADQWRTDVLEPDLAELRKNGQDYMPVIFPGFSWHNLNRDAAENAIPRNGGSFVWRQAYNARAAGATMLKIAMFDEVNEGTAMFKAASKRADAPKQGYWLTLDADGFDLPSDWYLRLAGEITKAFHEGKQLDREMLRNVR